MSFRKFFKVFIVLWTCSVAFGAQSTTPKYLIKAWEVNQHYCGDLLRSTVQIICKGIQPKGKFTLVYYETSWKKGKMYAIITSDKRIDTAVTIFMFKLLKYREDKMKQYKKCNCKSTHENKFYSY